MPGRANRLAWGSWSLSAALSVWIVLAVIVTRAAPVPPNAQFRGVDVVFILASATVGAVVASRRPENPVGWLFSGSALAAAVQAAGWEYAGAALVAGYDLPFASFATWLTSWLWFPAFAPVITVLPLVFPDGRVLSSRWRVVVWGASIGVAVASAGFATVPEIEPWGVANPLAAPSLSPWLVAVGTVLLLLSAVASMTSLAVRFRRSLPVERRQIGWLLYAAGLLVIAMIASTLTDANAGRDRGDLVASGFAILGLVAVPVACAVAVLRYHLFEIDRIVSRTVTYGLVVTTLAGVYTGTVILFGRVVRPLAGGDDLAIAGATLLVAALFGRLRRRVQAGVDRRFARSRYDAQRTIEELSARLRDEVDVGTLRTELGRIVTSTIGPRHCSLLLLER